MNKLPEGFLDTKVSFGPIGEQVFKRTYSQIKEDGTKETWPETVVRVVDGNISLVDGNFIEPNEREALLNLLLGFNIIPAGRHLSSSGMKDRQFIFNCHVSDFSPLEPQLHFSFLFDQLMQGGGVGANYSNRYLSLMPEITTPIDLHIVCREDHPNRNEFFNNLSDHISTTENYTINITDSREGWVEAVEWLISMAFDVNKIWGNTKNKLPLPVVIDVSRIRAKGDLLKASGGIACGPGPLVLMLSDLVKQLNSNVGRRLTSLDVMAIDHIIAACVIAGGKRRSSRMSVKSWQDEDIFNFINCKREDGANWSTNISVEIDDEFLKSYYLEPNGKARQVMKAIVLGSRLNGEPGIWNRNLSMNGEREPEKMYCPNPCGEIGLQGWENCCLGHVNLESYARKPQSEMTEAFRLLTRWLIRATFADIPQECQRKVVERNRRIGVGFTGFHGFLALKGIKYSDCYKNKEIIKMLEEQYKSIKEEAIKYSKQLNIVTPVKLTAIAPTGSISALPGVTSGCQALDYAWFKRLVRYSDFDPELQVLKIEGYEVFKDPDANNTSIVVFWCEHPLITKLRSAGVAYDTLETQFDISFKDSLNTQAMIQEYFADNAVSFTINLSQDGLISEEQMEDELVQMLPFLKGTTIFVSKSRRNMPIQALTEAEFKSYKGRKEITSIEDECKGGCPIS